MYLYSDIGNSPRRHFCHSVDSRISTATAVIARCFEGSNRAGEDVFSKLRENGVSIEKKTNQDTHPSHQMSTEDAVLKIVLVVLLIIWVQEPWE